MAEKAERETRATRVSVLSHVSKVHLITHCISIFWKERRNAFCGFLRSLVAGALTSKGMNALMACANNLDQPIEDWTVGGVPITMMCHMERRKVRVLSCPIAARSFVFARTFSVSLVVG